MNNRLPNEISFLDRSSRFQNHVSDPVFMCVHAQYCNEWSLDLRHNGLEGFVRFKSNNPFIDNIYDIHKKKFK